LDGRGKEDFSFRLKKDELFDGGNLRQRKRKHKQKTELWLTRECDHRKSFRPRGKGGRSEERQERNSFPGGVFHFPLESLPGALVEEEGHVQGGSEFRKDVLMSRKGSPFKERGTSYQRTCRRLHY